MKDILLEDAKEFRTKLYQKIENELALFKVPAGDVAALESVYQTVFDYLVDEFRGDSLELLLSHVQNREKYEGEKDMKSWIKEAAARITHLLFEAQITVIQQLSRLILGSLNLESYREMQEVYQVLSMMWMDLTSDATGKIDDEVIAPAGQIVKQMYLLPWLDERKDAGELHEDPEAATRTLSYLRMACGIAAEVNYRRVRCGARLDVATQNYMDEFFPCKLEIDAHLGKFKKAFAMFSSDKKKLDACKHGVVRIITSEAA